MLRTFIVIIFIFNLSGCGYNDIQTYDEQVNASWSEVLNQYQRRADLIPNLVASIKGYSNHEKDVLEAVTLARSQANRASSDLQQTPGNEQKLQAWQQAQAQVTRTLGQLTIISERYPELKAQELYQNLMVQLEGSENRIAVARGRYIKAIEQYNVTIRKFPAVLTAKVMDYIRAEGKYPVVIKADGLALGKGVLICENEQEAADGVKEIMLDKKFGASGNHVVVEEFLTGPEVSVLSFTDGKVVKPMVSSMDHKRANDHDTGLNTGGMGTIAPNPYYTPEVAAECMEKIFLPTIRAMNAEGCPFKGCLYFGLMLTPDGPKVIEYNCRFGDPETQVVLPLLESDLLTIMEATTNGTLDKTEVRFRDGAAACVILASGGYPLAYEKGKEILAKYGVEL